MSALAKGQPTTGPWIVEAAHGGASVVALVGGHYRQVAIVAGDAAMHDERGFSVAQIQRANADLMAAAPDMRDALEAARPLIAQVAEAYVTGGETYRQLLAKVDAALAKASPDSGRGRA